ncbi:MAG: dihydrodipicolinate synthase family protein [Candidatus Lindowbacteria bacterium]|nr:dihydrodipicolinate synthase family protein [Candidatus Lindowbacteria bacterium]
MSDETNKTKGSEANLNGIYAAALTPMSRDGSEIAPGCIGPLMDYMDVKGLDGVLVLGTTGEFSSLTFDEKKVVIAEAGSTRGNLKLIVGCSSTSLPETLELVKLAEKKKADAVIITPPFYFKAAPARGIEAYFETVLKSCDCKVLLYHIPANTGIGLERQMLERLSRYENFWGIKDTGGKLQETSKYLGQAPGKVLLGSDQLLLSGLKIGIHGAITACANIIPELVTKIYKGYRNGQDMESDQKSLTEFKKSLGTIPMHSALKSITRLRGIDIGGVRLPLATLGQNDEDFVHSLALRYNLVDI